MVFVYITAPDAETARSIGRRLVEEGLSACANIFPIDSIYRWKGEVKKRVLELHPYELPCIVWFEVGGHRLFLKVDRGRK